MKGNIAWAACLGIFLTANDAIAHYHILLPDKPSVGRDAAVEFTLRFGHPFEHQMFPTQKPKSVTVTMPDGQTMDLSAKLEAFGEPVGSRWKYTPAQRGDHVVFVCCEPVWMNEEKEFLDDCVKVVLHVQTQKGWDAVVGEGMELIPLTRPYGLRAGTVFQVSVRGKANRTLPSRNGVTVYPSSERQPLADTLVEVERYNPTPPKELPPDEHITRTVKTDPNGVATVTLPETGWWAITAIRDGGTRLHDGKAYPVKVRSTLWVPVDDRMPMTSVK
jgi:cobalt/nickel transport protein